MVSFLIWYRPPPRSARCVISEKRPSRWRTRPCDERPEASPKLYADFTRRHSDRYIIILLYYVLVRLTRIYFSARCMLISRYNRCRQPDYLKNIIKKKKLKKYDKWSLITHLPAASRGVSLSLENNSMLQYFMINH